MLNSVINSNTNKNMLGFFPKGMKRKGKIKRDW